MTYRRFLGLLLALMLLVMFSICALAAGDGSAENPYQIGDTVIGETEPTGAKAAGSRWVSAQVPAGEKLDCTQNHTHTDECYTTVEAHTLWRLEAVPDPASLTLQLKDAKDADPLAGVKFGLYTDPALTAASAVTGDHVTNNNAATDSDGKLTLTGFTDGTYYLTQETAATYYAKPSTVWKLVAAEAEGVIGLTVTIHESQTAPKLEQGVLQITNDRNVGKLTVNAVIEYYDIDGEKLTAAPVSGHTASGYSYDLAMTLSGKDWSESHQAEPIQPGTPVSYNNIPYGAVYEIKALLPTDATYVLVSSTTYKGTLSTAEQKVDLTLRYYYDTDTEQLSFYTVDSANDRALSGAIYTLFQDKDCKQELGNYISDSQGKVTLSLPADKSATYYLRQTKAPTGYHSNSTLYQVDTTVATTPGKTTQNTPVITTYLTVKSDLTKDGTKLVVSNKAIAKQDLTVKVVWSGDTASTRPSSVQAVLYRNGSSYKTVTLNASNSWTYTWEDLTDDYTWEIKQAETPKGYTAKLTKQNQTYTFTNYLSDIPDTGDSAMPLLWGALALAAAAGIVLAALKLRKR